jgi:uncharacterized protein
VIGVHVAQLLKAPVGATRSDEFCEDEPELRSELGLRGPIVGSVKVTRTTHGILADVQYRAEVTQECGRCLGEAENVVENRFRQEFLPTTNIQTGLPESIPADPDEPRIGEDHIIDLSETIRQDIVLEQPLRPLCRPDCAGLCEVCGTDLNKATCGHAVHDGEDEQPLGRLGELLKSKLPPA